MRTLEDLFDRYRHHVLFASVTGSQAYGTSTAPNSLELLFMLEDCVRHTSPEMEELIAQRRLFLTLQCVDTYLGYAMAQVKRARGQNKWINYPRSKEPPRKESFCYVLSRAALAGDGGTPARPVPLAEIGWNLAHYHAARLEHARDAFRLYHYGSEARGVFRGDELVCQSIRRIATTTCGSCTRTQRDGICGSSTCSSRKSRSRASRFPGLWLAGTEPGVTATWWEPAGWGAGACPP